MIKNVYMIKSIKFLLLGLSILSLKSQLSMKENLMKLSTIIFDMNGVIIDDEPLHEAAIKKVCLSKGISFTSEEYKKLYMGVSDERCFQIITQKYNLNNLDINELLIEKTIIYKQLLAGNLKDVSGVVQAIQTLSKKFNLALASSATLDEVIMILNNLNIKNFFKVIVSAQDVIHCKPDPEPYLLVTKKLNVLPEHCLVIEDSINGVSSAKNAGIKCIAITTNNSKKDLQEADFIIDNFNEIDQILKNNFTPIS